MTRALLAFNSSAGQHLSPNLNLETSADLTSNLRACPVK